MLKHLLCAASIGLMPTMATATASDVTTPIPEQFVGLYNITNIVDPNDEGHTPGGQLMIFADGTFDLIGGSFAAAGVGTSTYCRHLEESQTIAAVGSKLWVIAHKSPGDESMDLAEPITYQAIVSLVEVEYEGVVDPFNSPKVKKLIVKGSGGCGMATDRISVLERLEVPDNPL